MIKLLCIFIIVPLIVIIVPISYGFAVCEDNSEILENPKGIAARNCIQSFWSAIASGGEVDRIFAEKLAFKSISTPEQVPTNPEKQREYYSHGPYNWLNLAKLIIRLDSDELINAYLDYAIDSNSPNEYLSYGLGRLFTEKGLKLLPMVSKKSEDEKKVFFRKVTWGIMNELYAYLTPENYKRRIVCANWELLDPTYQYRDLVLSIQNAIKSYKKW